jgi:hypothetical protein
MRLRQILLFVIVMAGSIFGQVVFPTCGYLNGPACTIWDDLYWKNFTGSCDWGLASSNGTCVMGNKRQSLPYDQSWVVWAMNNQQRYGIGADANIDQILTVGTHNSYSSYLQGFLNTFSADQVLSITDQLNWGMRSIRIDPANYLGDWRVCHGTAGGCTLPTISSNRLFVYAVMELADWLNAHPNELIYLHLNSQDSDPNNDIEAMLTNYIPLSKLFTPADFYNPSTYSGAWPTMQKLLDDKKQLIVFSHFVKQSDGSSTYKSDLGFSFLSDERNITPADSNFSTCNVWNNTDTKNTLLPIRSLGDKTLFQSYSTNSNPIFSSTGEDRTASVATLGWGVVDNTQMQTAAKCGFSVVQLDFVNNLGSAYIDFAESGPDTRREAAVWSWAPGDYGTLGPAIMRLVDGRWTSAPTGNNYGFACAIDTDGNSGVSSGNTRHRFWYLANSSGPWTNGQSACAATSISQNAIAAFNRVSLLGGSTSYTGYFAFPRNGKENNDLWQAQVNAGMANLWLNYSANNGGESLIVNTNPVTVIRNGDPPAPLVFDISTSVNIPSTGVTLSVQLNLGTGSLTTDETTIFSPSNLRSYTLPNLWSTTQNPGSYQSNARIGIVSKSGATLAEIFVPFTIIVKAGTTTTITSTQNPVAEGASSTFQINVTSNISGSDPDGTIQLFELVYNAATQSYTPQNITAPQLWMPGAILNAVLTLPPGDHQIGATFTSIAPFSASSQSSAMTQTVTSYINPSPTSLTFTMDAGGSLPAGQTFSGKSFNPPPTITSNANWVAPFELSGQGVLFTSTIRPTPAAQSLSPGQYTGQITASDGTHVSQNVGITLNVRGALQVSTNSVSLLTSGADYTTMITLPQGGAFPIQINSGSTSWASMLVVPDVVNPLNSALSLSLHPQGLRPGTYTTRFQISSILSTTSPTIDITMTVVPLVTIDANVLGLTAAIDNVTYTLPQTFTWQPGSHHTISTTAVQNGPSLCVPACPSSPAEYKFTSWSSGSAISQTIVAPSQTPDTSAWHANFQSYWRLQTSVAPSGGGTISFNPPSPDGYYLDGSTVQITANPAAGYTFAGFSGDLAGTTNPQNLLMSSAHNLSAAFVQAPVSVTITSNVTPLPLTVDGNLYSTPATFTWQQGSDHTVSFAGTIAGSASVQYVFQSWADGGAISRTIHVASASATYNANFATQYYLNASPSPALGGSVTGSGWYGAGSSAPLQATAATGFQFSSFSNDFTSTQNPSSVPMNGPKNVAANFAPSGNPVIYAAQGGVNSDDINGNHVVPITLKNVGQGAAMNVQITSISNISVTSGTGPVAVVGSQFALPDLPPSASATVSVPFQWPSGATRIRFTVTFTANGGAYSGSTVLNVFR